MNRETSPGMIKPPGSPPPSSSRNDDLHIRPQLESARIRNLDTSSGERGVGLCLFFPSLFPFPFQKKNHFPFSVFSQCSVIPC